MSGRQLVSSALALALAGIGFACAASPRQRPLNTSPIGDSLQQVRSQFQGTWELVSLEIHPPEGSAVRVSARGTLVYDEYGNLDINGTITDPAYAKMIDSKVLASKGRAVIDATNKQIRLLDVQGNATDVAPEVSPDKTRRYEFNGNLLTLTSSDANGRVTAVATWKKQ
jgi:hypothetical protein